MWQRLLRLLSTGLNIYYFYSNPLRFIVSLLFVLLIPYLVYIFWGTFLLLLLTAAGVYLIFKALRSKKRNSAPYY